MPTLDTVHHQVLVDFYDDADGLFWHHRVLHVALGGSAWIGATPDESIQRVDLSAHRVIVLPRNGAFPAARLPEIYSFDPAAYTPAVEARLFADAQRLAAVHGASAQPGAPGHNWRISDMSHKSFGELVPSEVAGNDDLFIIRGDSALVCLDAVWTTAAKEATLATTKDEFERKYRNGPGRDRRLLGDERDPDGRRFLSLFALIPLLCEHVIPHWPIAGPRSVREFLLAIRAAGHTALLDYHNEWVKSSGVNERAAYTREHRFILDVLRLLLQFDQIDGSSVAGCELLLRRMYQIEVACRKSPKAPEFDGLEFLLETAVDNSGGAVLPSIAKWLGEAQHKEAFTLKQMRLWADEKSALDKRKHNNKDKDKNKQEPTG